MHQRQSTHVHFFLFAMCMQYDVRTVLVPRAVQEPYKVMETKMVAIQVGCCVLSCSCCVAPHALLCLCLCLLLVHGHVSVPAYQFGHMLLEGGVICQHLTLAHATLDTCFNHGVALAYTKPY